MNLNNHPKISLNGVLRDDKEGSNVNLYSETTSSNNSPILW